MKKLELGVGALAALLPGVEGDAASAAVDTIFSINGGMALIVACASMVSFVLGSIANAWIMHKMREHDGDKLFSLRAIVSTIAGEGIDSLIFFPIAFSMALISGDMTVSALLCMMLSLLTPVYALDDETGYIDVPENETDEAIEDSVPGEEIIVPDTEEIDNAVVELPNEDDESSEEESSEEYPEENPESETINESATIEEESSPETFTGSDMEEQEPVEEFHVLSETTSGTISIGRTIFCSCHSKPYRTRRNISITRSAIRQIYVQRKT